MHDYLVVGAGFAGSILAERIASLKQKKILVIDKRDHIGGNCYDFVNEKNIRIHKYGPHIFRTNSEKVWHYMSRFTDWEIYFHEVEAYIDGRLVPVPFNLNSIDLLFPSAMAARISEKLIAAYGYGIKVPILKLTEHIDEDIRFISRYIYDKVYYGYTKKQWGMSPEELDFGVTAGVPVHISRDNRYFQEKYQGIPTDGYTSIFEKMLGVPGIDVRLGTDYRDMINAGLFEKIIYTGPVDAFFNYKHGRLPYRSLEFRFKDYDTEEYQAKAQVNFPNNYEFTRITEFRHFYRRKTDGTTIALEFPQEYEEGKNDPYYPIPARQNAELYALYREEAEKLRDKVLFVGRLAEYKYYSMEQVVGAALHAFEKWLR